MAKQLEEHKNNPDLPEPKPSEYTTAVEVYSIKTEQPELKWSKTFPGKAPDVEVWRNMLVVGDQLIDLDTQEVKTAPWSFGALSFVTENGVMSCEANRCTMWKTLSQKSWESTLPIDGTVHMNRYYEVDKHVVVTNQNFQQLSLAILSLDTGEANQPKP